MFHMTHTSVVGNRGETSKITPAGHVSTEGACLYLFTHPSFHQGIAYSSERIGDVVAA